MLKAVVFDFDGTLADTFKIKWAAIAELVKEKQGIVLARKDCLRFRDSDIRELLKKMHLPIFQVPLYAKRIDLMTGEKVKKAKLFKGVKPLLRDLASRYSLGIVSTDRSEIVEEAVRNNKLTQLSFVFCGGGLFGKDRLIGEMLRSKHLRKEEVVYVGDEVRDVAACRKVGVRVIAVDWGFTSRRRLLREKPGYIAGTPAELRRIIDKIEKSKD